MLLFTRMELDRERALAEYRRLNPWFRAIPDTEVRCVNEDGKEVLRGKPGEVIKG